jgi:exonuclease SbcC
MIPHKLVIKNFLSYGENPTTIYFDNYQLICLSGKNGNGKSALLDALTWALWGQARKISGINKPDDGLLRLGASRMLVTLELLCNQQMYRVRREYVKSASKSMTLLDFEIRQEKGYFTSLTDKTIRATQEKINQTLGITFETFINSSFIRQGQSNEFSKKSPKERKDILSSILGLDHYQTLQSAALEKIRQLQTEQQMLQRLSAAAQPEIDRKPALITTQEEQKKIELELRININKNKEELIATHKKIAELEKLEIHHEHLKTLINKEQNEIKKIEEQLQQLRNSWKEAHRRSLQKTDKQQIESAIKQHEKKLLQYADVQTQDAHLKKQLAEIQKNLATIEKEDQQNNILLTKKQNEHALIIAEKKTILLHLQTTAQEKEKKYQEQAITLEKNKSLHQHIQSTTHEHAMLEKEFEKRKSFYHMLVQKLHFIEKNGTELQTKKAELNQNDSSHCPLCDQLVTASRKKFLFNRIQKDDLFLSYQKKRITTILTKLKKILLDQHAVISKKFTELQTLKQQHEQTKLLAEQQIILAAELKTLKNNIDQESNISLQHEAAIKTLTDQINKPNQTLIDLKKAITTQEELIKKINYDQTDHTNLQAQLNRLYQSINPEKIVEYTAEKQIIFAEVKGLIKRLKEMRRTYQSLEQEKKILPSSHDEHQKTIQEKKEFEQTLETMQANLETIVIKQTEINNDLARIELLIQKNNDYTKTTHILQSDINAHQLIGQAFSKNGIPALLIEEIIPELESEANLLLQKLTNNQAQIFIESVRDLKKGGIKETLDIHISDSAGIRPYEMFSGGEAFRIDFALRIAISKLLARKSGTPLQTLIIDEGFGSQDEEGLQKIMDALYKIQNDFAKIIIVSHLPLMKDNFPVHFVIEKNALGSQIRIEERG